MALASWPRGFANALVQMVTMADASTNSIWLTFLWATLGALAGTGLAWPIVWLRRRRIERGQVKAVLDGWRAHEAREFERELGATRSAQARGALSDDAIKSELDQIADLNMEIAARYSTVQVMLDEYLVATTRTAEAVRKQEADAEQRHALLEFNDKQVGAIRDGIMSDFRKEQADRDAGHAAEIRGLKTDLAKADKRAFRYFVFGILASVAVAGAVTLLQTLL